MRNIKGILVKFRDFFLCKCYIISKNLSIVTNAEDLIKVFELRSDVYQNINYQKEFPDLIDGLNLDIYDKNSAIIFYKNDQNISGTTRLIFDSENKLPSDKIFSFDNIRKQYNYNTPRNLNKFF